MFQNLIRSSLVHCTNQNVSSKFNVNFGVKKMCISWCNGQFFWKETWFKIGLGYLMISSPLYELWLEIMASNQKLTFKRRSWNWNEIWFIQTLIKGAGRAKMKKIFLQPGTYSGKLFSILKVLNMANGSSSKPGL